MPVPTWNSGKPGVTWNAAGQFWGPAGGKRNKTMSDDNNHVSLAFKKDKDPELIPFGQGVHDGITGNATLFATPPVTMPDLQTAVTDFDVKYQASRKGGKDRTEAKDAARAVLIGLLAQLAAYVEGIAQGDIETIRAAGFEPTSHEHHAQGSLTKPEIGAPTNLESTKVQLHAKSQPNVRAVKAQFRVNGGAWQDGGNFNSTRQMVVENLTPGQVHDFRLQFLGGSTGASEWSDVVSHLCT